MTTEQYWKILLKQWKLVLSCFVLIGIGTYIASKLMTRVYQSTVLVQVVIHSASNSADYNSLLASDQLVQTESQLAISDPVLREVASHYKGLTADELAKQVTTTVKLNTQIFEIDVQDPSPVNAAALANDIAATLIKQQIQAAEQDSMRSQQQIQKDLSDTQQQIDAITGKLGQLQAKLAAISQVRKPNSGQQPDPQQVAQQAALQTQISGLQTQLTSLQQHSSQWQTVLAQIQFAEVQNAGLLRVVQDAQPSTTPVRPQILLNTGVGLVAGLLLGILFAVLIEQLDTRVRTAEALTQLLGSPILATVWLADASKGEAAVNPPENSANIESYRILRTNMGFSAMDKPLHSILVTSATPAEGKSTVAANLAIFMAKAGKNTLLIDADLRHPTLHKIFHLSPGKMGLSNIIVALSQLQSVIPLSSTQQLTPLPTSPSLEYYIHAVGIPNLRVMPSGPLPPNPPELLESKPMKRLFASLANSGAEVVIFDTPVLLGLSDTNILASQVDGTLLVVDITRANKKSLKRAMELLTQTGTHVLGCVVNKQRHSRKDTPYTDYHYTIDDSQGNGNNSIKSEKNPLIPINSVLQILPDEQR